MYKLYHVVLDNNVIFEIPAESQKEALRKALYPTNVVDICVIPITEAVQINEEELEYNHAIGNVSYIIHHMVDNDGEYFTIEMDELTTEQDEIDYDSIVDIRIKLESPMDFAYDSIDEVKKAIAKAIDDVKDIYDYADYAMGY